MKPQPAPEAAAVRDMWIAHAPREGGAPVRLHGVSIAAPRCGAPQLLYLHGARCDMRSSALRMLRLRELGFAVLGIDYRGYGRSTPAWPTERRACEDAAAAWRWLAMQQPQARRYLYGHSLGGAIAVQLATQVDDAAGLILESTFTSLPAVLNGLRWGGRQLGALLAPCFDAASRVAGVKAPVLVVHGSDDRLVPPALGQALFECAPPPKRFVLVEGGTHHDAAAIGCAQYRAALHELFGLAS